MKGIAKIQEKYLSLYPDEIKDTQIPYNTEGVVDFISVPYIETTPSASYGGLGSFATQTVKSVAVKKEHLDIPHGYQSPLWKVLNGEEVD